MFLNLLNAKEKNDFLKLAVAAIKADGVIEDSEMQTVTAYVNEMQIPVCNTDDPVDVDAIIGEFASNSTVQVKRIVLVELLALVFADGSNSRNVIRVIYPHILPDRLESVLEFSHK